MNTNKSINCTTTLTCTKLLHCLLNYLLIMKYSSIQSFNQALLYENTSHVIVSYGQKSELFIFFTSTCTYEEGICIAL